MVSVKKFYGLVKLCIFDVNQTLLQIRQNGKTSIIKSSNIYLKKITAPIKEKVDKNVWRGLYIKIILPLGQKVTEAFWEQVGK